MGYTNYWECETDFTDDEWKAVCEEAQYIKDIDQSYQENMFRTLDGVDIIHTDFTDEICFNGDGNNGCETFYLNKKQRTLAFVRLVKCLMIFMYGICLHFVR